LYFNKRNDDIFKVSAAWLNAKTAILKERHRSLSVSEETLLHENIKGIQKMMESRGANEDVKEIIDRKSVV
jgi:hypothetical protein